MSRPVILGNSAMTVGLNEQGLVHDFYYPYVGQENLTTARSVHHKIGIWVDGEFSWVDDGKWDINISFENDALVSNIKMQNDFLGVELLFKDFVDSEFDAFCRQVTVINHHQETREIRIFMHQVFQISSAGRADTALYVPEENYILDYKGRCSLLVYGQDDQGQSFDQYAVGNYGIEGKEGTFRDAEDGELSGSDVEHGGVDSVIRFTNTVETEGQFNLNYWIVAAETQLVAEDIHLVIKNDGLKTRLDQTRKYWKTWLSVGVKGLQDVDQDYLEITAKSLMVIKAHIDKRGGIIASCDSSIYNYGRDYYNYVWPRDGAYAIWPLIRLGYTEEPKRFFEFCRDIMNPDGYLMHKYQPDKAIGSTWHPLLHNKRRELAIQEDETASVICMLGEYYDYSKDERFVNSLYDTLIQPAAQFMAGFIDEQTGLPHASYDLWEEKFLTNTYTVAITRHALLTAADFAEMFDYPDDAKHWRQVAELIRSKSDILYDSERKAFKKGYLLQPDGSLEFDDTLDSSSFYGAMMFGLYSNPDKIHDTVTTIEAVLLDSTPSGGMPRYQGDNYFSVDKQYSGNPWIVTTLWMAQYFIKTKQLDKAKKYINWAIARALPSGILPEQVNPKTGSSISVTPLVWSHAEIINTVLDISKN